MAFKRRFYDLHVVYNRLKVQSMLEVSKTIGFSAVALTLKNMDAKPLKVSPPEGLEVFWRMDLEPGRANRAVVARLRRSFDLVAVSCGSRAEFRRALKTRADLVFQYKPFTMNLSDVRLLSMSGMFFELNLKPLIYAREFRAVTFMRSLRRNMRLLEKLEIPVIVSSWASDIYELTPPLELPQHLILADVNPHECYGWVSENPARLLEVCHSKKLGLPEGVRILGG